MKTCCLQPLYSVKQDLKNKNTKVKWSLLKKFVLVFRSVKNEVRKILKEMEERLRKSW